MSCGSRPDASRWYCATTHPNQETRAEWSVMEAGFRAYLPLHIERGHPHGFDRASEPRIVPLFRGYLLVSWDAADQWRRVYRARGVSGIISRSIDLPTPIAAGVIEELIGRTSDRRIVDDPGADPPRVAAPREHWQDITQLSPRTRSDLLLRLFGREDVAA
jgi:Transcription termination factor nusG